MNIFATNESPVLSALALDDRRVNKMILESAQLLCTVIRREYPNLVSLVVYKTSHVNHPCEIWAREPANFDWLLRHAFALYLVKGGSHQTINVLRHISDVYGYFAGEATLHTPFANCTTHKNIPDTTEAYRLYLTEKWDREIHNGYTPTWRGRTKPSWYGD